MSATTAESNASAGAPFTNKVADNAHEQVDRAAKHAAKAEETLRERATDSSEAVQERLQSARKEVDEMAGNIERYARANPVTTAGIAFAAGILLSSLLRR